MSTIDTKTSKKSIETSSIVQKKEKTEDALDNYTHKILVNLHPRILSFLAFIFPLSIGVIILIIFIMQGRWSNYLPTISETGTEYPNDSFFAISMGMGSFTTGFCLFAHALYVSHYCKTTKLVNIILFILASTSSLGIAGLGFFSIHLDHTHHFMFAFMGFVSILLFEFVSWKNNDKTSNEIQRTRIISLMFAVFGLFLFGGLDWYLSHRRNTTITACGEYILLYFMMYIIYTYHHELGSVNIYIVLL
ncbi:hypothetical protein TRFO_16633 [Tritrichomonas foetus]|uniref:CWH43-like N-terminal domain-containing protein n=1 Tax=Tritrichomonas foetus TaxID=1144522 RepID=A0A1J4KU63_9EUKA|nr:hypothetical protein TRFO_16633 [Tritrichomonas foetus]|eukprot:OHT13300.1 hypothetical protein TRFO_16633 [Tritrichomonas foetus]